MKFELTQYAKLWSKEGRQIMTTILNNPDLIRANHIFWKSKFLVDPKITPTDAEGEATFKSKMRQLDSGVMMDMRAPLGDSTPTDKTGVAMYTGAIPDFIAKGFVEKATERYYKEKMLEQFGDAALLADFATTELQRMSDSANQTLSHMSAQVLSTGKIVYNVGEGIQGGLIKADIPAENFDTAGKVVWSDHTARLLDQMVAKEQKYRDLWGVDIPLQWEITRDQFVSQFMTNDQVIEWVRYMNVVNNTPLPEKTVISFDMARRAIAQFEGLSPIVLIEEKQKDVVKGMVHGWADNIAVLRPAGYAGYIRRTTILDEELYSKYGASNITRNFTPTLDGVAMYMNTVINNGNMKEWHSDLMMSAVPSLDEFLYHVIINTAEADA